jgi:hypothetical protein
VLCLSKCIELIKRIKSFSTLVEGYLRGLKSSMDEFFNLHINLWKCCKIKILIMETQYKERHVLNCRSFSELLDVLAEF